MDIGNRKEPLVLFLGDLCIFYCSLWGALLLRYGGLPSAETWQTHLAPFSILFAASIIVFFIAGLYEKHTLLFKSRLPATILNAVVANSVVAVLFFYFLPGFGITPKTNLFLYLIISFGLITAWRYYGPAILGLRKKENAILIGAGTEMRELKDEVNGNPRYNLRFISSIDLDQIDGIDFKNEILDRVYSEEVSVVVIDIKDGRIEPILPHLYNLIFKNVRFVDMYKVYEDIFDRIPLSLVRYNWFLENVSASRHALYDVAKRGIDVTISLVLGVLSLVVYPLVVLAIKLDDGGAVFIRQERVGKNGQPITIVKFRSMSGIDVGDEALKSEKVVTRVGRFLRKSRIDELPQLWNVLAGDLALIGPRPELPSLVRHYSEEISYYHIRHVLKPGLSGWAQLYHETHPHHGADVEETKKKLSYDLYYIKNRSVVLDLAIALKTVKTLLLRAGI